MNMISPTDYYKIKRVSNSLLSLYSNPRLLKMKMDNPDSEDEDKRHFRVGSALDCMLTGGDFAKEFVIADIIRPYGFMSKFVESLPDNLTLQSDFTAYVEAYQKAGYKMPIERVISNFWANEEAVKYYRTLAAMASDKRILSKDEAEVVYKAYELISANEFIKPFFIDSGDPDVEIQRQVVVLFEHKDVECKGMLDVVYINHKTKTIQPIDLKTIGKSSVWEFPEGSYIQYGYYRQAAFYDLGIRLSGIYKDLLDKGYKLEKFLFCVVEVKPNSQHPCVGFRVNDIEKGLTGFKDVYGKYHPGIDELLEAYKWHNATNKWDLPYGLYKSNGIVDIQ